MQTLSLDSTAIAGKAHLKRLASVLCVMVVLVSAAWIGSGCTNSAREATVESDMADLVIVRGDQGKSFQLNQGDVFVFRLEENPTTAYLWEFDVADERLVEFQTKEYSPSPEAGIGGGGITELRFRARSPGTTKIQLKLKRKWESDEATDDRLEVTIHIQR